MYLWSQTSCTKDTDLLTFVAVTKQSSIWRRKYFIPKMLSHLLPQLQYICSPTRYTKCFNEWLLFSTYVSSTCFGPHRSIIRSVLYKLYLQIWYVVIRVLLDTSSRYEVTAGRVQQYANAQRYYLMRAFPFLLLLLRVLPCRHSSSLWRRVFRSLRLMLLYH